MTEYFPLHCCSCCLARLDLGYPRCQIAVHLHLLLSAVGQSVATNGRHGTAERCGLAIRARVSTGSQLRSRPRCHAPSRRRLQCSPSSVSTTAVALNVRCQVSVVAIDRDNATDLNSPMLHNKIHLVLLNVFVVCFRGSDNAMAGISRI